MPRTIWKGAISFGLVHVPVALRAAAREHDLDFDWLDRRDMARVGYKRVNKRTGKEVESEHIVKGYQYEPEQYVLLSDEDFRQANPEATQSVDIQGFVDLAEITPAYFMTPYYLEALRRGEKGYALLREVLRTSGRAGIASVVIHTKQHPALLLVQGEWLMLITMRFADELLAPEEMTAVPDGKKAGIDKRELAMAQRLVDEMTHAWQPEAYTDTYRDDLLARIKARVEAGQTHEMASLPDDAPKPRASGGAKVIDLMAALRESLDRKGGGTAKAAPNKTAPAKRGGRTAPAARKARAADRSAGVRPRKRAA